MKKNNTHERGQALIMIAVAIIGLIAMTALAIDGGNAYSDRRQAQNAADAAVLAAAHGKIRNPGSASTWKELGRKRAADNKYIDSDYTAGSSSTLVNVEVYGCNETSVASCPAPYTGDDQYIQVLITSQVKTYFAMIVGVPYITNRVSAISRASEPIVEEYFDGNALVSLKPNCPGDPPDNKDPFKIGGNANTQVKLTGVFINSSCDPALIQSGTSSQLKTGTAVCVVGGSEPTTGVVPPPQENCGSQKPANYYKEPNPVCNTKGSIVEEVPAKVYRAYPGYFDKKEFPDASPAGKLYLEKGIYCIRDGFSLNAGWTLTTDLNDNDTHDADEGVLFVVEKGPVTINGGAAMEVHAITSLLDGFEETWLGLLFYVKDGSDVTLSGSSGSSYVGTIFAPRSHCTVQGAGGVLSLDTQIICYTNELTGNGTIDISYNSSNNNTGVTQPGIELIK